MVMLLERYHLCTISVPEQQQAGKVPRAVLIDFRVGEKYQFLAETPEQLTVSHLWNGNLRRQHMYDGAKPAT